MWKPGLILGNAYTTMCQIWAYTIYCGWGNRLDFADSILFNSIIIEMYDDNFLISYDFQGSQFLTSSSTCLGAIFVPPVNAKRRYVEKFHLHLPRSEDGLAQAGDTLTYLVGHESSPWGEHWWDRLNNLRSWIAAHCRKGNARNQNLRGT